MFGFAKKLVSTIESQLTTDTLPSNAIDETRMGLRVLSVKSNSIGSRNGFESWFDYIIAMNDTDITAYLNINTESGYVGYENFINYIRHEVENSSNGIKFTVFSSKGSIIRDVNISNQELKQAIQISKNELEEISLSSDNKQDGSSSWSPNLGLSFQLTPLSTGFFTWHVLRVHPNSPAYSAGIMPGEYIVQSQDGLLATGGEDLLSKVLQSQYLKTGDGTEIVLYIYNYDHDCVRPARIVLQSGKIWGGRGILGCDIGYGLLHRIPEVIGKFDNKKTQNQSLAQSQLANFSQPDVQQPEITQPPEFLPITVSAPSFSSDNVGETVEEASSAVVSNPHRKRQGHSKHNVDLNAYFDEQTKINQDTDTSSLGTLKSGVIPPPPPSKK